MTAQPKSKTQTVDKNGTTWTANGEKKDKKTKLKSQMNRLVGKFV